MHRNTIRTCACFREHARTGACVWACMQRIIYTKTQNGDRPRPLFCAHTTPQACAMVGAVCSCRSVSQMPCPAPYDPGTRNWAQRPLKTTTLAVTPQCSACHQGKRNTHTHDMLELDAGVQALPKPDDEEVERVAAETQAALDRVVQGKQAAVNPATLPNQPGGPQYIK